MPLGLPEQPAVLAPAEAAARPRPWEAPLEWETCPCPLCGANDYRTFLLAPAERPLPPWRIVRCRHCELCYTNPRPTPAGMARFYPPGYPPHQFRPAPVPSRPARRTLGRLLDFGCGNGSYLLRMYTRGWEVTGIDTASAVMDRLRRVPGPRILAGTLPHPALEAGTFERITMRQSLEHVHDALGVLREARRLLAPGGRLTVAVPNLAGLPASWFGADWFGLDLPRHLVHFTPDTLVRLLTAAGFRPGRARMERRSSWLRASARRAGGAAPWWRRALMYHLPSRLTAGVCALLGRADSIVVDAEP